MGFSRQEYWSELSFPPPGDLPNPGIEPESMFPILAGGFLTTSEPGKPSSDTALNFAPRQVPRSPLPSPGFVDGNDGCLTS